jgi:hypothetical protein
MNPNRPRIVLFILCLLVPAISLAADGDSEGRSFGGLRFGAGVSVTIDTGGNDRVESAEIVDGYVRVTEEKNVITRILLETHYFFPATTKRFLGIKNPGTWAWGPFVGVQSSSDDVIDAFAMGLMVGFRKEAKDVPEKAAKVRALKLGLDERREELKTAGSSRADAREVEKRVKKSEMALARAQSDLEDAADEGGASTFNIGIGAVVDPRVQILGDEFVENQEPPGNETEVRYKTTDQWGVVVLVSFSF